MDNFSSSDLDSPSKTPLFIAIAAVIVAFVGLAVGWLGFSRATELEARISQFQAASEADTGLEQALRENADRVDQVVSNMSQLSQNVSEALNEVSADMSKIRSDVRKVAIDAGTAKKMVEDLEQKGIQVSMVPTPSGAPAERPSSASESGGDREPEAKSPDASPGQSGVYTVKSGDTLGRIAAAYNITLSELQAANPGVDPRRLRIGQQLVVPATSD